MAIIAGSYNARVAWHEAQARHIKYIAVLATIS